MQIIILLLVSYFSARGVRDLWRSMKELTCGVIRISVKADGKVEVGARVPRILQIGPENGDKPLREFKRLLEVVSRETGEKGAE